jgi:nitrite reductase (NADH) small subunit
MTVGVQACTWTPVCPLADLQPERAVAAIFGQVQVAIVRTFDGNVYAVSNTDPVSRVNVMSRGIVGSRGDRPTIASPLDKEVYDLVTGHGVDDPTLVLATYDVRVEAGVVEVAVD